MQGTATFTRQVGTTGTVSQSSSSSTVPRLLLGARVSFGALSALHTFVGVDGELGPARVGDGVCPRTRLGCPSGRWASRSAPPWGRRDRAGHRAARSRDGAPTSDPDLLRRLAGGEIGALGELYDRYREPVRRFLARATSDAEDVDDLVHATFLAAAKSAGALRRPPFVPPLARRDRGQLLRRRRRSFGQPPRGPVVAARLRATATDPRPALQARADVERALRPHHRGQANHPAAGRGRGPELRRDRGLRWGCPIGTVWTRLHAARRELRGALEEGDES